MGMIPGILIVKPRWYGDTQTIRIAKEKTFGPVAPVNAFEDLKAAVEISNSAKYGLAVYVLSGDIDRAREVAEQLEFGVIGINDLQPIIVEAPRSAWMRAA